MGARSSPLHPHSLNLFMEKYGRSGTLELESANELLA